MKLPWDQKYLKISFHVVLTLIAVYVLAKVVDAGSFLITNVKIVMGDVGSFFSILLSILSPLIMAFVIAYILNPLVDFFQEKYEDYAQKRLYPRIKQFISKSKYKLPRFIKFIPRKPKSLPKYHKRTAGAILTYLMILFLISIMVGFVVFRLGSGVKGDFWQNIIDSINRTRLELSEITPRILTALTSWNLDEYLSNFISGIANGLEEFLTSLSKSIPQSAASIGGKIANFLIALVVAFYFMRDKEMLKSRIDELAELFIPRSINRRIYHILSDVHVVFSGYIQGQLTDAIIMSVLLSAGLSLVGVDFAILIGIFSGLANIIPYFGAIIAFIISVLVAFISGTPMTALYAAIIVLVLQQIDGIFIVPRVVGQKVELSPVMVILSLAVFGNVFGFAGMILAVPVCAIMKIFILRFLKRRRLTIRNDAVATSDEKGVTDE